MSEKPVYDARRQEPQRPVRPEPPGEPKPRGSWLPVMFVIASTIGFLLLLFVLTGPAGLMMVAVIGVLLAVPVLHYLTWGWWLSGVLRDDGEGDDQSPTKR